MPSGIKRFGGWGLVEAGLFALSLLAVQARGEEVTLNVVASFAGTNGYIASAPIIQARDGNFYGTTYAGGASTNFDNSGYGPGYGAVFKGTPEGELTCLASFFGTNGSHPYAGLVQAADGNFYGVAYTGGNATNVVPYQGTGYGTVFRVAPGGSLATLYSFDLTNGACPRGGLVEGPDGCLYGTTRYGGLSYNDPRTTSAGPGGYGTIFKITTNGSFTTLYSFTPDTAGSTPMVGLLLARDGNFYGPALGGAFGWGMIYKLTLSGEVSTVASLAQTNALPHLSPLIEGRDGNLYGVSQIGGAFGKGAAYQASTSGLVRTIASFPAADGLPWGSLVEGTDGNFYGVRTAGSSPNYGLIYQLTPAGAFSVVFSFVGLTNGAGPRAGLIQAKDGNLYGTTEAGGSNPGPEGFPGPNGNGYGTVFRLHIPSAMAPKLRPPVQSGNGLSLSWSSISGRAYQVQYKSNLHQPDWADLGSSVAATNRTASASDAAVSDNQRVYRVVLLP